MLVSHETPRIPPQELREAPTPTLGAGGGAAKHHYSVKVTESSCCPKLTIDSFIGDVVHVEALGAVGSPNFVAVLRLLLRSSRQNQHDQRVNDTENQQRLHFVSAGGNRAKKIKKIKAKGALRISESDCPGVC